MPVYLEVKTTKFRETLGNEVVASLSFLVQRLSKTPVACDANLRQARFLSIALAAEVARGSRFAPEIPRAGRTDAFAVLIGGGARAGRLGGI